MVFIMTNILIFSLNIHIFNVYKLLFTYFLQYISHMLGNDISYLGQILECVIYNIVLLENEIQHNGHIVRSQT